MDFSAYRLCYSLKTQCLNSVTVVTRAAVALMSLASSLIRNQQYPKHDHGACREMLGQMRFFE
jgi:hypothetical protein